MVFSCSPLQITATVLAEVAVFAIQLVQYNSNLYLHVENEPNQSGQLTELASWSSIL
jgi:hypothetical protein